MNVGFVIKTNRIGSIPIRIEETCKFEFQIWLTNIQVLTYPVESSLAFLINGILSQ